MFNLKGKSAVITGAASGIGKAVAIAFVRQGATVHILDLNQEAIDATLNELKPIGASVRGYPCDVTDQKAIIDVFNKINHIDILVNSAGISHIGKVETTPEQDFDRIYSVNVKGVYNCLYAAIPLMKKNNGGVILNVSSVAACVGLTDRFA